MMMDQLAATELLTKLQLLSRLRSGLPDIAKADYLGDDRAADSLVDNPTLTPREREEARKVAAEVRAGVDAARWSADFLMGHLPAELGDELRPIPVGALADLELNAGTLLASPGQPIIVVNNGLQTCFSGVGGWWASAGPIPGAPAEASLAEASLNIFRWLLFYGTHDPQWMPEHFVSRYEERRGMIGAMWTNAFNFVLGHEYAHVLLGHLAQADVRTRRLADAVDGSPEVFSPKHAQEFAADAKGAEIAFSFAKAVQEDPVVPSALGIELVFQIFRLQEVFFPPKDRSSHPPALERLNALHRSVAAHHGHQLVAALGGMSYTFDLALTKGREVLSEYRLGP